MTSAKVGSVRHLHQENPGLVKLVSGLVVVVTAVTALITWVGGQATGPGARIDQLARSQWVGDSQVGARVDSLRSDVLARGAKRDREIGDARDDILVVLQMRCSDQPLSALRAKNLWSAAARCEVLLRTGK